MLDIESGSRYELGSFPRNGFPRELHVRPLATKLSSEPGWQSHGGPSQKHPARGLPTTLSVVAPKGVIDQIHLVGIFALYAGSEKFNQRGASICLTLNGDSIHEFPLHHGHHYFDGAGQELLDQSSGDGSHLSTVGCALFEDKRIRLDVLSISVPRNISFDSVIFRDMGTESSFVIFDVVFEIKEANRCPFHSANGGVSLADLAGIVRVRDRVRFQKAVQQMFNGFDHSQDIEEARGEALTFLAVVTAGMLEAGGSRSLHRVQLEAARTFDQLHNLSDLKSSIEIMLDRVVGEWLNQEESQPRLIEKALTLVDRNFARDLTDETVANEIGLSTSHFRFLFKQSVGQPFHKFLIASRLERAKLLLEDSELSVSEIAHSVGFGGLASFSRAFNQRFSVSPSEFRKVRGK
jgi:AraC-like DNA-binding protein